MNYKHRSLFNYLINTINNTEITAELSGYVLYEPPVVGSLDLATVPKFVQERFACLRDSEGQYRGQKV